jgi:hypothetical protein
MLAGFCSIDDSAGLQKSAIERLTTVPREQTLLAFTVRSMEFLAAQSRPERLRMRLGLPDPEGKGPRSAADIAATMTPENLNTLEQSNRELQEALGVQLQGGPQMAIQTLAAARQRGQVLEVQEALTNREQELRMHGQRKSLAQVAAGLRT